MFIIIWKLCANGTPVPFPYFVNNNADSADFSKARTFDTKEEACKVLARAQYKPHMQVALVSWILKGSNDDDERPYFAGHNRTKGKYPICFWAETAKDAHRFETKQAALAARCEGWRPKGLRPHAKVVRLLKRLK